MGTLFALFRFVRDKRSWLVWSFVLLMVSVLLEVLQPKLIEWAIDSGMRVGAMRIVTAGAIVMFALALCSAVANAGSGWLLTRSGQSMGYALRNALFQKVMSFSFHNLDSWRTGELLVRINADVNTVRMFVRMGLLMIARSVVMIVGSLVIMFLTNVRLASVMAVIMPATVALFFFIATRIRPMFTKVRESLDELNNVLQENLAGAKLVRAFSQAEAETGRFDEKNRVFMRASLKVGYTVAVLFPLLFFIGQMALLATLWLGGAEVIETIVNPAAVGLTLGQLIAFNNYAMMAMFPILMLGFVLNFIAMASASAERIQELFDTESSIREAEAPKTPERLEGDIEYQNVTFSYGEGEPAVSGVSLRIRPGENIGLLGSTGSGKSTLANLVPRFYDPDEGAVLIDGTDVREIAFASLRSRITMVLQETVLFSRSIGENIAFGKPGATQEDIERAAVAACADGFIGEKEGGYEEHVGERGAGLSGGQRQRIAIARAIVSDPDILILDDATSSVDLQTERSLIDNLYRERAGRTTIIISQKINAVRQADRIVLFQGGEIAAVGTHEELLRSSEAYREIYDTQSAQLSA